MPGVAAPTQHEESRPATFATARAITAEAASTSRRDGDEEDEPQEAEACKTTPRVRITKQLHRCLLFFPLLPLGGHSKVKDDSTRPL